jgi:hypothetical protein
VNVLAAMNDTLIQNVLDEVLYGTPLKIPADPEVKAALGEWLRKHPKHRDRPYIWLSLTLCATNFCLTR